MKYFYHGTVNIKFIWSMPFNFLPIHKAERVCVFEFYGRHKWTVKCLKKEVEGIKISYPVLCVQLKTFIVIIFNFKCFMKEERWWKFIITKKQSKIFNLNKNQNFTHENSNLNDKISFSNTPGIIFNFMCTFWGEFLYAQYLFLPRSFLSFKPKRETEREARKPQVTFWLRFLDFQFYQLFQLPSAFRDEGRFIFHVFISKTFAFGSQVYVCVYVCVYDGCLCKGRRKSFYLILIGVIVLWFQK